MANNTHIINLAFVIHDVFLIISKQLNLVGSIVPPNKCVAWFPSSLLFGYPFLICLYPFKWHQGFGHSIWLPFLHFVLTLGSLR
jgi:hypothetical protein